VETPKTEEQTVVQSETTEMPVSVVEQSASEEQSAVVESVEPIAENSVSDEPVGEESPSEEVA